jgi:hypothetical protein
VIRAAAASLSVAAFAGSVQPLPPAERSQLAARIWHAGCPVPLSQLRRVTVTHWGFDGRVHRGELVVNERVAAPVLSVFRRLYALHFPIRRVVPIDDGNDATSGFSCRRAAGSPCPGAKPSGGWSMHAYGEAVDLNPRENPYTGCGVTRDRGALPYLDRTRVRRGMVTGDVVAAFRAIGWAWGGDWSGTKDYMHFSANGH